MDDRLRKAWNGVRAGEELKNRTKTVLSEKTSGYTRGKAGASRRLIAAAACLLLMVLSGHWLYFTPTVEISIDVNPSIELGVNRFDRVISVSSCNQEGEELAEGLDIKYLDYLEAVEQILTSEEIDALLSGSEVMTIGVIGAEEGQAAEVLAEIEARTAGEANMYCFYADPEEVSQAHEAGLSYGKYKAFLELQGLDPTVTPEEVQTMTMREIRDRIAQLSDGDSGEASLGQGNGHNGMGAGGQFGYGQGRGPNRGQGRRPA